MRVTGVDGGRPWRARSAVSASGVTSVSGTSVVMCGAFPRAAAMACPPLSARPRVARPLDAPQGKDPAVTEKANPFGCAVVARVQLERRSIAFLHIRLWAESPVAHVGGRLLEVRLQVLDVAEELLEEELGAGDRKESQPQVAADGALVPGLVIESGGAPPEQVAQ